MSVGMLNQKIGLLIEGRSGGLIELEYPKDLPVQNLLTNSAILFNEGQPLQTKYPLQIFSLRGARFLEPSQSMTAQKIRGEDVLIFTEFQDTSDIKDLAKALQWDTQVMSWQNLNWKQFLLGAIESIPFFGKALAGLFKPRAKR
jgi:hypothetical protein